MAKNQTVKFNGNKLTMPVAASKKAIKSALAATNPDIVHVMVPYSPFMAAKVVRYAPASAAVIGTFHIFPSGWLSRAGSRLLKLWLAPTLKRFSVMSAVSQPAAEFARTAYGLECQVIPNPVDVRKFKVAASSAKQSDIVFLGRLVKRKGAADLIKAFALLGEDFPKTSLIIAGDGPDKKSLEELSDKLGVSHRTRFLGYIDEEKKPGLLNSAAIACFPSLYGEAFGIVLIEAMAAGAGLVLGGDNPGYRSVLGGGPDLLFEPGNPTALADKLRYFLSDPKRRAEARAWQADGIKQYDISVVGDKIEKFYAEALIARGRKKVNN